MSCELCWRDAELDAYLDEGRARVTPLCLACALERGHRVAAHRQARVRATTRQLNPRRDHLGVVAEVAVAQRYRSSGAVVRLDFGREGDRGFDLQFWWGTVDVKAQPFGSRRAVMMPENQPVRADVYVAVGVGEDDWVLAGRCWCLAEAVLAVPVRVLTVRATGERVPTRLVEEAGLRSLRELDAWVRRPQACEVERQLREAGQGAFGLAYDEGGGAR